MKEIFIQILENSEADYEINRAPFGTQIEVFEIGLDYREVISWLNKNCFSITTLANINSVEYELRDCFVLVHGF